MIRPPLVPRALLRLRLRADRREEIDADLLDLFERRLSTHSPRYARRRYWWDALSFCRQGQSGVTVTAASPPPPRGALMSAWLFDLKQVLRAIRCRPAFFSIASVTLAVGFASHLAAFSVVDRMLLAAPAHVRDADRIVRLHIDRDDPRTGGRFLWYQTPYRSYRDLRDAGAFSEMAAYRPTTASVGTGAEARQLSIVFADEHYFPLLGATPQVGRVFDARDNQAPSGTPVVVLSDAYWRAAHGRDPDVIGQTLRIGAIQYTIVGVMPKQFIGDGVEPVDAWAPLYAGAYDLPPVWTTSYLFRSVTVLAKLAPSVTSGAAAEQVTATYRHSVAGTPAADRTAFAVLASLKPGRSQRGDLNQAGQIAVWIQGVALLVLLVSIANVVNLQMSRAAQQRRETAVRVALGASRGRLLTRVTLEMIFITGAGALLGLVLTFWSAATLQQLLLPGGAAFVVRSRLAFMAGAAIAAATIICVALSALQVRTNDVSGRLKSGRGGEGFGRERFRQALLVSQVVVSALLLVGAGLFLRSIHNLGRLQFGHDHERVLVVTSPMRNAGYSEEAIERFYTRALDDLRHVPGIERVAAAQSTPFAPSQAAPIEVPGAAQQPLLGDRFPTFYTITPDFFDTMGMRIIRGRSFTDGDRAGAPPVMILEQALADVVWPGQDPVGKCLVVGAQGGTCREIVGVVSNTRRFVQSGNNALRYYVPMAQRVVAATPQALFLRAQDPLAVAPQVRQALLAMEPNLPYLRMRTLNEMSEPEKRPWRMGSTLFVVFGAAALLVATAGVYALLSFIVAQRTREIGVRLALGANRTGTLMLVFRQSLRWVALGLLIGLAAAVAAGRFMRTMLFETSPYDPAVFAVTTALLGLVAIVASLVPAIRASRVDPIVALRVE